MNLDQIAYQTIKILEKHQCTLSTVESCTGGLLAHLLTDVPGAAAVFFGAWIVYDTRAKVTLGVPANLVEQYGTVSPEVAASLADAGLEQMRESNSQRNARGMCLATTGIAGPGGATASQPRGRCFLGLARMGQETQVRELTVSDVVPDPALFSFLPTELRLEAAERVQRKREFARRALMWCQDQF